MDNPRLIHRPVYESRFAIDELPAYRAKVAAVAGYGTMISHNEKLIFGNDHLWLRTVVGEPRRDIRLRQGMPVYDHAAMVDLDAVAGQSDDTV